MSWVKLDDQFADHPKVLEVGPLAECLFVRGLTYASRYLTDGYVPAAHLRRMGDLDAMAEAEKLVRAGLWEEADGGFLIHDYLDYQPSAEKVRAERDAARERMQKARSGKREANNDKRSPEVHPNNTRSSDNPVPSRPVPNTSPDVGDTPTPPARAREKPTKPTAKQIPDDFALTDERLAYASDHGMSERDARLEFETLRNWAESNGTKKLNWDATWRNWVLRREKERTAPRASPPGPPRNGYRGKDIGLSNDDLRAIAEGRRP